MHRLRVGLLFGSWVVAVACSEHLPRALESAPPAAPVTRPVGLDARPVAVTCTAKPRPSQATTLIGFELVTKLPAPLDRPVEIVNQGGVLYILEQEGKVLRLSDDGTSTSTVLDLKAKTAFGGEAGLLGIAFHPRFSTNGFVYVYHTVPNPPGGDAGGVFQSALVRYHSNDGGLTLDPASEKRIMTVAQPYSNHNGGTIAFGNDGFLYWGLGDGGAGGDPQNRAQNPQELLGKMVRIDVDGGDPYAIPPTNPYATGAAGRPEIFASGLRNPFRFRFDPVTGDLWAGDVGQGAREEIDKIVLAGNYGWVVKEGKICYPPGGSCDGTGLIDPVVDHGRAEASTITGGVVYRGSALPFLTGKYVYADFALGTFWAIPTNEAAPTPLRLDEGLDRVLATAFALDKNGEMVFVDYNGSVYRIVPGGKPIAEIPERLSETGCIGADPSKPATGLFPYDVNAPQWIDGTTASRFLALPPDVVMETAGELAKNDIPRFVLPPGGIAMKTILDDPAPNGTRARIETQLILARPGGEWSFYSYVWNAAQTDATLAHSPTVIGLPSGRRHLIVDRAECASCHSLPGHPILGLEPGQLDRDDVDYGGRLGNPLATLEKVGLTRPTAPGSYSVLAQKDGYLSAERRARAYLHANCAHCHRGGEKQIDLRYTTPVNAMNACNQPGKSKAGGRLLLVPREPDESQVLRALRTTADGRMPPLGSLVADDRAAELVSAWISSLASCD